MTIDDDKPLSLHTPVEIAPRNFKPLRDCTREDLAAAVKLLGSRADQDRLAAVRIMEFMKGEND